MATYFMLGLECDDCGKSEVVRAHYHPPYVGHDSDGDDALVVGGPPIPEMPDHWEYTRDGEHLTCGCKDRCSRAN